MGTYFKPLRSNFLYRAGRGAYRYSTDDARYVYYRPVDNMLVDNSMGVIMCYVCDAEGFRHPFYPEAVPVRLEAIGVQSNNYDPNRNRPRRGEVIWLGRDQPDETIWGWFADVQPEIGIYDVVKAASTSSVIRIKREPLRDTASRGRAWVSWDYMKG